MTTPKGRFGNLPLDPVEMLAHVDEYLLELEATLHARDYVRINRVALTHFSAFCRREGIDHPTRIQRGDLLRFQHFLSQNPNWSVSYKRQLLKYARAYINWMESMGYLEENPWVKIRVGRTVKQPKPLEDEELDALFAAHKKQAFSQDPFYYHRRELMLAVLYGWGLRLHEACALNMQDMDLRRDFVTAINKGGGTKSLPYIDEIKKSFQRWVRWRNTKACVDDALFVNTDGSRMNPDQMRKVLVTLAGSAGVAVNPHRLRDTAATNMLDQGMSVERVQRILGHKNIAQTLAYTEVRDKTLAEEHSKAMNPKLKILFNNTSKLRRGKPAPE